MPERAFLGVAFTPVSPRAARAVSGFLRYVQYRDQHPVREARALAPRVDGLLKYVAHRDRSVARGLLFGAEGSAGDDDRRALAAFIRRGCAETRPLRFRRQDGGLGDKRRAVYRFVLSPEHARGLDLQQLTRTAMAVLARDAGVERLRWIAAQHRNTAHPHVHIVLAGFTEPEPGRYRPLLLTKRRLQAMKDSVAREIARQRGLVHPAPRREAAGRGSRLRSVGRPRGWVDARRLLRRAARQYRWEVELEALMREREERSHD